MSQVRPGKLRSNASRHGGVLLLSAVLLFAGSLEAQEQREGQKADPIARAAAALKDPRMQVRIDAVTALGSMTGDGPLAVPLLVEALSDPSEHVRRTAALGLARLAPTTREAVAPLARALEDTDPAVQDNAVWGLQSVGPMAFPVLIETLASPHVRVRVAALEVLQTIFALQGGNGLSPAGVEAFVQALNDPNADVRAAAARSLGTLGAPAQSALPRLQAMAAGDEVDYVRDVASDALRRIPKTP